MTRRRHTPPRALLRAVTSAVFIVGVAACGDSPSFRSNTPRVTATEDAPDAEALLLTEADVRAIEAFGDVVAGDLDDVSLFENPDPRGPCGAMVSQAPLSGAVGRAFSSSTVTIVQLVVPTTDEVRAYVDSLVADKVEGCGPYNSTTNVGLTQTVSEITFVDIAEIPAPSIAWTMRIAVGPAPVFAGASAFVGEEHTTLLMAQSPDRVSAEDLKSLTLDAHERFVG